MPGADPTQTEDSVNLSLKSLRQMEQQRRHQERQQRQRRQDQARQAEQQQAEQRRAEQQQLDRQRNERQQARQREERLRLKEAEVRARVEAELEQQRLLLLAQQQAPPPPPRRGALPLVMAAVAGLSLLAAGVLVHSWQQQTERAVQAEQEQRRADRQWARRLQREQGKVALCQHQVAQLNLDAAVAATQPTRPAATAAPPAPTPRRGSKGRPPARPYKPTKLVPTDCLNSADPISCLGSDKR